MQNAELRMQDAARDWLKSQGIEISLSLLRLEKNTFDSALCIQHSALTKYGVPWKLNIESIMMQLWEQQLREN